MTKLLSAGSSIDANAARVNAAMALAHIGRLTEAMAYAAAAMDDQRLQTDPDAIAEAAELHALYGDPGMGRRILDSAPALELGTSSDAFRCLVQARLELIHGRVARAQDLLARIEGPSAAPGFRASISALTLQLRAADHEDLRSLGPAIQIALSHAEKQQAWFWWKTVRLTEALVSPNEDLVSYVRSLKPLDTGYLAIQAELVAAAARRSRSSRARDGRSWRSNSGLSDGGGLCDALRCPARMPGRWISNGRPSCLRWLATGRTSSLCVNLRAGSASQCPMRGRP